MVNTTKKQLKTKLALSIINQAKDELTYSNYQRFLATNYRINSRLMEFKKDFVFNSKEFVANLNLYKKGNISWENLKSTADRILKEQLKECNIDEIDYFFEIKR